MDARMNLFPQHTTNQWELIAAYVGDSNISPKQCKSKWEVISQQRRYEYKTGEWSEEEVRIFNSSLFLVLF